MRLGASLFAIALLLACSSSSNHATNDAGSDAENDSGPDTGSSSSGGSGSSGSSGSGGSGVGSSSGTVLSDAAMNPCMISLKGAISFAFPCTTKTVYFTAANRGAFTISVADPRPLQLISITLQHQGPLMSGMWSSTDPAVSGGAMVQEVPTDGGMTPTWQVTAGAPADAGTPDDSGSPDAAATEGSYTLDLMVGQGMVMPGGETFGASGTFTATLPAVTQSGATGVVTIHANF